MSEKILILNENEQNLRRLNATNYYHPSNDNESTINKCYQCILCSPMFFQRKRNQTLKRLWGLRVNQVPSSTTTNTVAPLTSSSQQHQHQQFHQLQLQQHPYNQTIAYGGESAPASNSFLNCCGNANGMSATSYDGSQTNNNNNNHSSNNNNNNYTNMYQFFCALAKKLKDTQIQTLCQAVEHGTVYDGQLTNCVLVPRCVIDGEDPHVIACRLWRWPDLRCANELKRIPTCPNELDPIYVCCNPMHWYRLCRSDTPPPPYSLLAMERLKPEDRAPSEDRLRDGHRFPGSLSTDGEETSSSTGWCQLAYWELSQRVGRLFPVENPAVNVFAEQPRGDGLCLTTLAMQRLSATPDAVLKARQKIGLGVTLSRETDGMWIYNRSSAPVFVHSPTLSDMDSRSTHVFRVPPGHCLRAFDHMKAAKESYVCQSTIPGAVTGPVDKYSVRISFAKGWGPNYQRTEVISCPCWLEVLLSPCR